VTSFLTSFLTADPIGLLERHVTVAVAEISRSGCLLETSAAIPAGTIGTLSVEIEGSVYSEDVRVARCLTVPGAGERHHVGVEFLTLRRPGRTSLRLYAAALGDRILRPGGGANSN
jgi:hypothetical protein